MQSAHYHTLGSCMMWFGVIVMAVTVIFIIDIFPVAGLVLFLLMLPEIGVGVYLKRKHCPCGSAEGQSCAIPNAPEERASNQNAASGKSAR